MSSSLSISSHPVTLETMISQCVFGRHLRSRFYRSWLVNHFRRITTHPYAIALTIYVMNISHIPHLKRFHIVVLFPVPSFTCFFLFRTAEKLFSVLFVICISRTFILYNMLYFFLRGIMILKHLSCCCLREDQPRYSEQCSGWKCLRDRNKAICS